MKYKIGIDVSFTILGGTKPQIINMLNYLSDVKDIELVIYSKKNNNSIFKNINLRNHKIILSRLSNISALCRVIWEQFFLPFYVIRDGIDVLFCPGDITPIFSPIKKVQWIGTIGPFWKKIYSYEIGIKRIKYPLIKFLMYKSAERADYVIFESEYTQKYFLNRYNISKDRTTVINIGKDEFFTSIPANIESNYRDQQPYALCVSHLYPYKNIPRMIRCFCRANKKLNDKYRLLLAGAFISKKYTNTIRKEIDSHNYSKYITLLGAVSKESLKDLCRNTEFLIFPSPCENFAYTLVEAMSVGVPIVCSNSTAMPETCQEAAMYFDSNNTEEMAEKIELLMNDKDLRKSLSHKSLERVKELPDYKEVTTKTLNIINSILDVNKSNFLPKDF